MLCAAPALHAQDGQKTGGSPLDTILRSRLKADVPEAKDFVRQSRRSGEAPEPQPAIGSDPKRPSPRTKAELEDLRSELESAAASNEARAGRRKPLKAAPAPTAQKAKVEKALAD